MTLRVYDDEGTPYEQTIDIRETAHRTEIQYNNTRRAKRKRKDNNAALTNGEIPSLPTDDVVLSLGDVLQSANEIEEWKLADWTSDDDDRMAQDAFEWIRIDADLEWICDISLGMPEWMYAAQLQQDRDVVAQYEVPSHLFFLADVNPSLYGFSVR
jgi:transcription initiation factor TFIID subunit 2